jgi:hypothetical protein
MNRILILLVLLIVPSTALAGKLTYDLLKYTAPAPFNKVAWKKDLKKEKNSVSWSSFDNKAGTYCQVFIMNSVLSKGDIESDFESEWTNLVVPYGAKDPPQRTEVVEDDGWKVTAGVGTFAWDTGTSVVMLTTISGYDRAISIVGLMNTSDYVPAIQALLSSIEMVKPKKATTASRTPNTTRTAVQETAKAPAKPAKGGAAKPAALQGYMNYNPITKTWQWQVRYPPPQ